MAKRKKPVPSKSTGKPKRRQVKLEAPPEPAKPSVGRPAQPPAEGLRGEFGQRVKALREAKGMTGHDLAAASGLSKSLVYRIEAGGTSTIDPLSALADALDVTMAELLKGL